MNASINKTSLLNYAIGITMVLMALSDLMHSRNIVLATSIVSVLTFIFHFPFNNRAYFLETISFIVFILITSLINLYFTQNSFGGTITILGSLLLSYMYIRADIKKLTIWVVLVYVLTIGFIAYHLFVLQTPANDIYEGSSRNHAGAAVVFFTIFLLFHLKIVYNIFPIVIPLIAVMLSFFLFGRTSIAVSGGILITAFYFKFSKNIFLQTLMVLSFICVCYYLWIKFGALLTSETNFGEGLDTPRWELWDIYFQNINFINFLTGIDVNTLPMYDQFGGNPHNSFIKFHSRVGLGSVFFVFLFFISIFQYLNTKQFYVFWLLIFLTTRAFFDSDILIGNFDFIFFIVTFYWIKTK